MRIHFFMTMPADSGKTEYFPKRETHAEQLNGRFGGYGPWPFADTSATEYPSCLPDGRPWPRISIVTPTFNYGHFLEQTILSVINQRYPNVQHLIIDGGSKDQTLDVLERYRSHLDYVVSEPDRGQSHAINKGMARADGEIVTWLNGDDMLAPGALYAAALTLSDPAVDMVAGICRLYRDGILQEEHLTSCAKGPLPLPDLLDLDGCWMAGQFFMQPEVLFKKTLWDKAGAHVREDLYYSMDYELWLRFAEQQARLHVIGRPLAWFRLHSSQKTVTTDKFVPELRRVRDEFASRCGVTPSNLGYRAGKNLKIAFVNDIGFNYGAGIAHRRLAAACAAAGHRIFPVCCATVTGKDTFQADVLVDHLVKLSPDLLILGNLHYAELPPDILDRLSQRWPVAMVLHDQWVLTGRCAYVGDCQKYLTGCDEQCPTPNEYPALAPQLIHDAWETKYRSLTTAHSPTLLANSQWMADFARQSLSAYLQHHPATAGSSSIQTIRLAIDMTRFRPRDRRWCREALQFPQEQFLLLISATHIDDPRKGLMYLVQALQQCKLPNVTVVCLGHASEKLQQLLPNTLSLGFVDDDDKLAMIYSAVDLFVGPSQQEALGQVFLEAAACGTPSIGFAVGGVPEALRDGISGRLVQQVSVSALAEAIRELYENPTLRRQMGVWGRIQVENEWSAATAYQKLFVALRQAKITDRLHLPPKIGFRVNPSEVPSAKNLATVKEIWSPLEGIDSLEGPYNDKQLKLPRFRWLLGGSSRVVISVPYPGKYRVNISCGSLWPGRRLRVIADGRVLCEHAVPTRPVLVELLRKKIFGLQQTVKPYSVQFDMEFRDNHGVLELQHFPWSGDDLRRPLALMLFDITASEINGGQ